MGRETVNRLRFAGGMGWFPPLPPTLGAERPGHYLGRHEEKAASPKASTVRARAPRNPPLRDTEQPLEKEDEWSPRHFTGATA